MDSLGTPILVVGMGRSGSSAVASALLKLGIYGGNPEDFSAPDEGNVAGYFEHQKFNDINDSLRISLGMLHNSCIACPQDWLEYDDIQSGVAILRKQIEESFSGKGPWMIKDPRISLLLPIYEHVLAQLGVEPRIIVCARKPKDSARSFAKKFDIPERIALGMWIQHTLIGLKHATTARSRVVLYEALLRDPTAALRPVLDIIPDFHPSEEAWSQMADSIRPEYNHGSTDNDDFGGLGLTIFRQIHELCREAAANPHAFESGSMNHAIEELHGEFQAWWSLVPYQLATTSRVLLAWQGGNASKEYAPMRRPQAVEIPFALDQDGYVEGQFSDWPGTLLMRSIELIDLDGHASALQVEKAGDVTRRREEHGTLWTLPRAGQHFRFPARTGKWILRLTFSANVEPHLAALYATSHHNEILALRQRAARPI